MSACTVDQILDTNDRFSCSSWYLMYVIMIDHLFLSEHENNNK